MELQLAELIVHDLPWVGDAYAAQFAEGALALAGGLYPYSNPSEPVAQAIAEIGMADPHQRFVVARGVFENRYPSWSLWLTMLMTLPSGARTRNLRTPHGSVVRG
jgi:tetracycline repressor-like protein